MKDESDQETIDWIEEEQQAVFRELMTGLVEMENEDEIHAGTARKNEQSRD